MNKLFITYKEFWEQFKNPFSKNSAVPAYQEGYAVVKKGSTWQPPPLPYIVYPVVRPAYSENALFNVTVWDKATNPGQFPVVNAVVEQIAEMIGEEGVVLTLDNNEGAIWLMRGTPFVTYPQGDPDDPTIVRGMLNLIARGYML